MKKKIIFLTAALLSVALCACTGNENAENEEEKLIDSEVEAEAENDAVPEDTYDMFSEVDVSSLPEKEEGKTTVKEDFAKLSEKVVASHSDENFTMVLTFYFEDGKAAGGYVEGTYKNLAQAKTVYDSYVKNTEYYANVKREGGKITYTHTDKSFEAYKGKTVEEIKESVTESGFEITEG